MKFIVFEGLNGSGKSSLAKALALNLHGDYITSPHQDIAHLRAAMDESSLPAHFFYYMLGNILISDAVRNNNKEEIVVCDRYLDSTLARHKALGLKINNFGLKQLNLLEPDISFFIHCNETERRQRIEQRGKKNKWDILDEDDHLRKKYVKYFHLKNKFYFFDNSHETEQESLNRIISVLVSKGIV